MDPNLTPLPNNQTPAGPDPNLNPAPAAFPEPAPIAPAPQPVGPATFNPAPAPEPQPPVAPAPVSPSDSFNPAVPSPEPAPLNPASTPDPFANPSPVAPAGPDPNLNPAPAPQPVGPATFNPAPAPVSPQPGMVAPSPQPGVPQPGMVNPGQFNTGGGSNPKIAKFAIIGVVGLLVLGGLGFGGMKLFSMLGGSVKLKEYTSSELKYSIKYPEKWEVDSDREDSGDITEFSEVRDTEDTSEDSEWLSDMEVTRDENKTQFFKSFDEYSKFVEGIIDAALEDQKNEASDSSQITTVTNKKKTKIAGMDALRYDLTFENANDKKGEKGFGTSIFLYTDDDQLYTFEFRAHESDKKYFDKIEDIVSSFKIQ